MFLNDLSDLILNDRSCPAGSHVSQHIPESLSGVQCYRMSCISLRVFYSLSTGHTQHLLGATGIDQLNPYWGIVTETRKKAHASVHRKGYRNYK